MHEVFLERGAERDLKRMPALEFSRVIGRIQGLANSPRPPGSRKIAGSEGDWRIRIGDYRVVYAVDEKQKVITIFRVRHRKDIYR